MDQEKAEVMTLRRSVFITLLLLAVLAGTVRADGLDGYVVSLAHLNGSDGSTTVTDATGTHSWNAVGNAQLDTAQSVFGGAALLLDGSGDLISSADSADWRLDGGSNSNSWTLDLRVRFATDPTGSNAPLLEQYQDDCYGWDFLLNDIYLTFVGYQACSPVTLALGPWDPSADTWYHVAVVKDGTTGYRFFVDGTQLAFSPYVDSDPLPDYSGSLRMGVFRNTDSLNGWIDEPRISKGIARWTSDFTPPSSEYSTSDADATATAAGYQTQTAAALTATYEANQTATAAALTATYEAHQTETAAALTQVSANLTSTAAAWTATPTATNTPTNTPTPTHTVTPDATQTLIAGMTATSVMATALQSMPTPSYLSSIRYGDLGDLTLLMGLAVVMLLGFLAWLIHALMAGGGK